MKHILLAVSLMVSASCANAQQATWNGRIEFVTTITGHQGVQCGYMFNGQEFNRVFRASTCPSVVNVEVQQSREHSLADCEGISSSLFQQCVRTARQPTLAECESLSFSLNQVCIQRATGR